jgi:hypothetical protein
MWKASSWLVSAKGQLFLLKALLQMRVKAMGQILGDRPLAI